MATQPPSSAHAELERRIGQVGLDLAGAIRRVVDSVPGAPLRPQELARVLGVNKDLSSRVLTAASKKDALAAAHYMPGPEPLRQLLKAASRKGVAADLIRAAEEAIADFERLIRSTGGDRAGLDAIIGAWLPDARERFETGAKQTMFRGAASLKGVMAETSLVSFLVHPNATKPDRADLLMFGAIVGLRRLRPGAVLRFTTLTNNRPEATQHELNERVRGILLDEFCSPSPARVEARQEGPRVHYVLQGDDVGPTSAADLFMAEFHPDQHARTQTDAARRAWLSGLADQPVRTQIVDVLLHRDVWPGSDPELRIYDTVINGIVRGADKHREIDRLDLAESVQSLGQGLARFRASEIPNYVEALRTVCARRGWNGNDFRGYRCRIDYPFYGSQVCMLFELPPGLENGGAPPVGE